MDTPIVILGATATGKTRLAVNWAEKYSGEIISADSRQVYKELNIGSGKDLDEYRTVPYHLIDICDLNSEYNVFNFQRDCLEAVKDITSRNKLPIICGGTGLYLNSILSHYQLMAVPENPQLRAELASYTQEQLAQLLSSLNPALHNKTDLEIRERSIRAIEIALYKKSHCMQEQPKITAQVFKLCFDRDILHQRIKVRLLKRLDEGMIEEVRSILNCYPLERILRLGLEYKFTALYLKGELSYEAYVQDLYHAICQFAKRQETWFRKMQRDGVKMIEIDGDNPEMLH